MAAERGVLLPVNIDGTKLPFEFRRKQTADLSLWTGNPEHEGFQVLCRSIQRIVGEGGPLQSKPAFNRRVKSPRFVYFAIGIAIAIAMLASGVYLGNDRKSVQSVEIALPKPETSEVPAKKNASAVAIESIADAILGTYVGDVTSDSKGSSRANITVILTRLSPNAIRATSSYDRLGTIDIELTQTENKVFNAGGDTPFVVDLGAIPPTLSMTAHHEVAYSGTLRQ